MAKRLWFILAALFIAGVVGLLFAPGMGLTLLSWLRAARGLGWGGAVVLFACQVLIASTGLLPASLLGVAAGALYGPALGSALAGAATFLAAYGGYEFGRAQSSSIPTAQRRHTVIDRAATFIARDGWLTVFLLRLSPILPFAATSIALGATGIRKRDYFLGTAASLPSLVGYAYVGSVAGDLALSGPMPLSAQVSAIALAIGALATLISVTRIVGSLAKS